MVRRSDRAYVELGHARKITSILPNAKMIMRFHSRAMSKVVGNVSMIFPRRRFSTPDLGGSSSPFRFRSPFRRYDSSPRLCVGAQGFKTFSSRLGDHSASNCYVNQNCYPFLIRIDPDFSRDLRHNIHPLPTTLRQVRPRRLAGRL